MSEGESLPINCVARNSVWVYPREMPPRFQGAPAIVETTRSHIKPDFAELPEGADVAVEVYGGALTFSLAGDSRRVYVERFEWASFPTEEEARAAFASLWERISMLDSVTEAKQAAAAWLEEQKRDG